MACPSGVCAAATTSCVLDVEDAPPAPAGGGAGAAEPPVPMTTAVTGRARVRQRVRQASPSLCDAMSPVEIPSPRAGAPSLPPHAIRAIGNALHPINNENDRIMIVPFRQRDVRRPSPDERKPYAGRAQGRPGMPGIGIPSMLQRAELPFVGTATTLARAVMKSVRWSGPPNAQFFGG